MKITRAVFVLIIVLVTSAPALTRVVSYSTVPAQQEEKAAKGIRGIGEIVCLFESGTPDVISASTQ